MNSNSAAESTEYFFLMQSFLLQCRLHTSEALRSRNLRVSTRLRCLLIIYQGKVDILLYIISSPEYSQTSLVSEPEKHP